MRKMPAEQLEQLFAIQLAHMELVAETGDLAVGAFVGRGDQEQAVLAQYAGEAGHQPVLRFEVLEGLERDHDIEAGVIEAQRRGVAGLEMQLVPVPVTLARVCDRGFGNVEAKDFGGNAGKQIGAVAFATGRVEHALVATERHGEGIAVPVLVPDLAYALGREALAGEFKRVAALSHDLRPAAAIDVPV